MIIAFCDLKGSTRVLRELGGAQFRQIQVDFFARSSEIIQAANKEAHPSGNPRDNHTFDRLLQLEENMSSISIDQGLFPAPWARIDKFMGDCTMFYIDCKQRQKVDNEVESQNNFEIILNHAAVMTMRIVSSLADAILKVEEKNKLKGTNLVLGTRIGIALGDKVFLSWLGEKNKPGYSYTVTGAPVNLAARLEHATTADFLSCIAEEKAGVQEYGRIISNPESLHGTALGDAANDTDQYLVNLYTVCEKRFQVRANTRFVEILENCDKPKKLRWRHVPFAPQGFDGREVAQLLGGETPAEMLRTV